MPYDYERQEAMLTKGERKFLMSDRSGYSRQSQYEFREVIKERVKHSILDFSLLLEHWPEEEREEVFADLMNDERGQEGLADMIAVFYLETRFSNRFDHLFGRGIRKAEDSMAGDNPYSVHVQQAREFIERVHVGDTEHALEKFSRGRKGIHEMTDMEMRVLLQLLSHLEYDEFNELQSRLSGQLEEFAEDQDEAVETRQRKAREKQDSASKIREEKRRTSDEEAGGTEGKSRDTNQE